MSIKEEFFILIHDSHPKMIRLFLSATFPMITWSHHAMTVAIWVFLLNSICHSSCQKETKQNKSPFILQLLQHNQVPEDTGIFLLFHLSSLYSSNLRPQLSFLVDLPPSTPSWRDGASRLSKHYWLITLEVQPKEDQAKKYVLVTHWSKCNILGPKAYWLAGLVLVNLFREGIWVCKLRRNVV